MFPWTELTFPIHSVQHRGKLIGIFGNISYAKILVMIFISRSVCWSVPVASVQLIFVSLAEAQLHCELSYHDLDHTVFVSQIALFEKQQ